jgi:hypothetical protein
VCMFMDPFMYECYWPAALHRECVVFWVYLDPCLSLLNIYLKRSPPAFFKKKGINMVYKQTL